MNCGEFFNGLAVCLAATALGSLQPCSTVAAGAAPRGVIDVGLREGGVLSGQVVDQHGLPLASVQVTLLDQKRQLAATQTDRRGLFAFRALRGGVYRIAAAGGVGVYRVWAPGTAPPSVQPAVLLVAGTDLVRGQYRGTGLGGLGAQLAGPLGLVAVVGAGSGVVHNALTRSGVPVSPP